MKKNRKLIINGVLAVAVYVLVMVLVNTGMLTRQLMSLIIPCCTYTMLAVSLSLVVGFLGELSLGHAAFLSIGAYAGALVLKLELPIWIGLPAALLVGGAAAGILGVIIGMPVLRLRGDYLAIVTLGFGEIIKSVFNAMTPITGGAKGLSQIPLVTTYRNFTPVYILTVLTILVVAHLVNSRHGRAVCAIRDNYIAAEAVGIPVSRYKILAFVVAAVLAGMAGVVYAGNIGILKPTNFDYNTSIEILVMVVLGGMGNIGGTVAAALILLTPWRKDRIFVDPFCGCGTFPIEAALMAAGIAPGMNRSFTAEQWKNLIPAREWYDALDEAREAIDLSVETDIQGYDADGEIVRAARENAKLAGVDHLIHFQQRDVAALSHPKKYGFLVTNPPYGERIEDRKNLPALYRTLGERLALLDSWSAYIITAYEDAEACIGRKADKNRKIYNGMMKTYFYQFLGPKPPRRRQPD